jgi:type I restriction enzyme S subunit
VAVATRQSYVPLKAVPLAELVEFRRGLTYKKSDEVALSSNAVLRANNIDLGTGSLDLADVRFISDEVSVPVSKKITADSLLICTASGSRSHLGKVAYIEDDLDYAFGGFMGLIVPGPQVLGKFLYYFTRSNMYSSFIDSLSAGANINNLRFSDLGQLRVPVPRLDEQKRIVAVLDQAFAALDRARAHAEANLADAGHLFDAWLTAVFHDHPSSWRTEKLRSLCHQITVGHVGPMAERYVESGMPFLRSQNIRPFEINLVDVKFIDDGFHNELKKSALVPGDVAIVRTGYPGTAAVIPQNLPIANCADLVIARPKDVISPEFLVMFLNSSFGKSMVAGKAVGAAQKHFNVGAAKEVDFSFPPIAEQERLVAQSKWMRSRTDQLESTYQAKLAALATFRQSLLQKAFSGNLMPD